MSGTSWAGAAVAGIAAVYALGSKRLSRTPVSSAFVFAGFGVLLGPVALDAVNLDDDTGPLLSALEAALTLVLFVDAMAVPWGELRAGATLPGRLLGVGLPLSIAAGWLFAWLLLPGLTVWEFALLGAILAPTDAALGAGAIANPRVPRLVRQTLNVESGLNDGMVLPFFVIFLAGIPGTSYAAEGTGGTVWRSLVLSTVLGIGVGWLGGRLLAVSYRAGWIGREWGQIYFLALAAGAYALAVQTQGSGFIAAWMAGAAVATALRRDDAGALPEQARTAEVAEYLGSLLAMISLLIFGAVLLGPALEHLSWRIVGYAVLSLTVVRMIPVALALAGSRLRRPTVAYVAWFGPRGLASIVLGLLTAEERIQGAELIGQVIAVTVGLSIVLHGASAVLLSDRYARWYERAATATPGLRESAAATVRLRPRGIGAPDHGAR
ncbi:MAG TPA: cation:proton antiporter [Actinospica sp.]|nr:cation:proton antiporter [Actinospica sp.]